MEAYWYIQLCYIKIKILSTYFDTINPVTQQYTHIPIGTVNPVIDTHKYIC